MEVIFEAVFLFMLAFLVVWMALLPIGVKIPNSQQIGNAKSAPEDAFLLRKFIAACFLSAVITFLLMWFDVMTNLALWALKA